MKSWMPPGSTGPSLGCCAGPLLSEASLNLWIPLDARDGGVWPSTVAAGSPVPGGTARFGLRGWEAGRPFTAQHVNNDARTPPGWADFRAARRRWRQQSELLH